MQNIESFNTHSNIFSNQFLVSMINLMKLFSVLLILLSNISYSQVIEETLISEFDVQQNADVFDFSIDKATGKYCYVIWNSDHTAAKIQYGKSVSEEFNSIISDKIRFFSDGSYAAFGNFYEDTSRKATGTLIVNGKSVFSSEYIDWYSSYINKNDELILISKEGDKYYLIRYSIDKGIKRSEPYDELRAAFTMKPSTSEEGDEYISDDEYLVDGNGKRLYVGVANNKAYLIQGDKRDETPYTDIDFSSIVYDRNGEMCYIAKSNGELYTSPKGFFVVKAGKKFRTFDYIYPPLYFDASNSIYYIASDSIAEYVYDSYLVKNEKKITSQSSARDKNVTSSIQELRIDPDGSISYVAWQETKQVSADNVESYNTSHSFVEDGKESFLGYNLRPIVRCSNEEMLFVAQSKLGVMKFDLFKFDGSNVRKVNKEGYDEIYGYGFTPDDKIYYLGMREDKTADTYTSSVDLYIDNVKIGNYGYLIYQLAGDSAQALVYSGKGDYAFVTDEKLSDNMYYSSIHVNGIKLPQPKMSQPGSEHISNVYNLFYTSNGKMFFTATTKSGESYSDNILEAFVDNSSLGKTYNSIGKITYDKDLNSASFLASRGKGIYEVKVKF